MRDCPSCHRPIDGLACQQCEPAHAQRTGPPGGFAALYAKCQPEALDEEAAAERAAIQAEGA